MKVKLDENRPYEIIEYLVDDKLVLVQLVEQEVTMNEDATFTIELVTTNLFSSQI